MNCRPLMVVSCFSVISNLASAQTGGNDADLIAAVVEAAQKVCGMKGASTDIKAKANASAEGSKVVAQLVNAKINAEAEFTKAEWEGIERAKQDVKTQTDCTQNMTPLFLDRFKKKQ